MMKVYMKGMGAKTRGCCSTPVPLERTEETTPKATKILGLGLANNEKLMALNIKKKKSKNISFEL
jgi:hypothetical protein